MPSLDPMGAHSPMEMASWLLLGSLQIGTPPLLGAQAGDSPQNEKEVTAEHPRDHISVGQSLPSQPQGKVSAKMKTKFEMKTSRQWISQLQLRNRSGQPRQERVPS